jgi:hypothetical protein
MTAINAIGYARSHRSQFVADLFEFLRLPTISAQPTHASDMKRCASWLTEHLRQIGLDEVVTIPTAGHPIVYAQRESGEACRPFLFMGIMMFSLLMMPRTGNRRRSHPRCVTARSMRAALQMTRVRCSRM